MKNILLLFCVIPQVCAMNLELNDQLLLTATWDVDFKLAKEALKKGADVNAQNIFGSALTNACLFDSSGKLTKLLIAAGADVNSSAAGQPIFIATCLGQSTDPVKSLLAAGVDITTTDATGETRLNVAWRKATNLSIVRVLARVAAFLSRPKEQFDADPANKNDYRVWAIAYKKDEVYDYIVTQNTDMLKSTKSIIDYFLIAARVGNVHVLTHLKNILKERKPEALKFVCLKAYDIIMKCHPELIYLIQHVVAEDIAPTALLTHNKTSPGCEIQ